MHAMLNINAFMLVEHSFIIISFPASAEPLKGERGSVEEFYNKNSENRCALNAFT